MDAQELSKPRPRSPVIDTVENRGRAWTVQARVKLREPLLGLATREAMEVTLLPFLLHLIPGLDHCFPPTVPYPRLPPNMAVLACKIGSIQAMRD